MLLQRLVAQRLLPCQPLELACCTVGLGEVRLAYACLERTVQLFYYDYLFFPPLWRSCRLKGPAGLDIYVEIQKGNRHLINLFEANTEEWGLSFLPLFMQGCNVCLGFKRDQQGACGLVECNLLPANSNGRVVKLCGQVETASCTLSNPLICFPFSPHSFFLSSFLRAANCALLSLLQGSISPSERCYLPGSRSTSYQPPLTMI